MRKLLVTLLPLAASGLAQAQAGLREGHPDRYTMARGDILWDISGKPLRQPWKWPELWHVNPQIQNPHLICPGDTLSLVYVDGQPCLVLNRGELRGAIKLSPKIRSTPIAEAVPTIPLDRINSFLLASRIVDDEKTFTSTSYIVASNAGRIINGTGDRIYVRNRLADGQPAYGTSRQGRVYIDSKTREVFGINTDDTSGGEVVATEGDIATLMLTHIIQEACLGDRLFPTEERAVNPTFMPDEPSREVKGEIIDVPRGVTQISRFDAIILNHDQCDRLAEGNVLVIYEVSKTVRDRVTGESVKISGERTGLLMVFRTYKKLSYALVLMTSRPLSVIDKVQNP